MGTVMCSYNRINGQYGCENEHLLHGVLERDWSFPGYVLADYGAAHDTPASLNNGLDFEPWPGIAYSPVLVDAALVSGRASPSDVDEHVRRMLRTLFAFGFFDRAAYRDDDAQIDKPAHARVAREVETSAATLLVNRGVLSLDAKRLRTIAVIGAPADSFTTGGGSGGVVRFSVVTPREAIARGAGPGVSVRYDDRSDAARAARVARGADVALVFAADYQTEGVDRRCLTLECPPVHGDQDALIERVAAANPDTVIVLETGGPVLTPWRDRVKGLLEAWYPGAQGGPALADVLFGDADPGGRRPVTFPRSEADEPTAGDPETYPGVAETVTYKEGVLAGYRWWDAHGLEPAFPFGAGLWYARFALRGLRVTPARRREPSATVSVEVRNRSRRIGVAVPQLYVGLPPLRRGEVMAPKQLKGFAKLRLRPGARRRVAFELSARDLSSWDGAANGWRVADGCVAVMVGTSSRAIAARPALTVGRGRLSRPPRRVRATVGPNPMGCLLFRR